LLVLPFSVRDNVASGMPMAMPEVVSAHFDRADVQSMGLYVWLTGVPAASVRVRAVIAAMVYFLA
jgi:hypothetical protein